MAKKQESLERILVVEDAEVHQKSATLLRNEGYIVDIVGTFRDATEMLDTKKYNIVLTDNFLPAGEGAYGISAEMKRKYARMPMEERPIRAMTSCGRIDEQSIPKALGIPVVLYAIKHGVQNIAIVSDGNHHDNIEASLLFNDWSRAFRQKSKHTGTDRIGGAHVMVTGYVSLIENPDGTYRQADYKIGERGVAKDWSDALQELKNKDNGGEEK